MTTATIYSSPIKSHELLWFDKIQVLLDAAPQCSAKKCSPKSFTKFRRKWWCQSLFLTKLQTGA